MKWLIPAVPLFLILLICAGCASAPATVLTAGNGSCHPSDDLPAKLTVPAAPESDLTLSVFLQWVIGDRKWEGDAARDYNSLYNECVTLSLKP